MIHHVWKLKLLNTVFPSMSMPDCVYLFYEYTCVYLYYEYTWLCASPLWVYLYVCISTMSIPDCMYLYY